MKRILISTIAAVLCIAFAVMQVGASAGGVYENAINDGEISLTPASEAERERILEHSSLKRASGLEGTARLNNFDVDPQSGRICAAYYGAEGYYENGGKSWAFAYDSNGNVLAGWSIECNSRLSVSWIDGVMYAFISKTNCAFALYDDARRAEVCGYSGLSGETKIDLKKRQIGEQIYEMKQSGPFSGYDRIEKTDGGQTVCLIDCSSQENSPFEMIIALCCFAAIVAVIALGIAKNRKQQKNSKKQQGKAR